MLKKICLSIFIYSSLYAQNIDINNLTIDDMGSFFIRTLNLSESEAKQSADELYEKGLVLFSKTGKEIRIGSNDNTSVEYKDSSYKRDSMRYLVASGLLGNANAALLAMKWLNYDSFLDGSRQYRYFLAKKLNDDGYLYGTYILALGYVNGNGIAKDRDKALYYLGIVKDYCESYPNESYASLSVDKNTNNISIIEKTGKQRCSLSTSQYNNLKNNTFVTDTPIKQKVQENIRMRKLIQDALISKKSEAIESYMMQQGE